MEQLPVEIEQKIEKLPILALDAGDEFQKLIFSKDFTDIFNYYKENYLPDVLKSKSEIYQRISLYLTLTNQDTSFIEQTDNVLYRRPCPTIEEFLDNKFYMGYSNATLYPYWKEQLKLMFKEGSPVRKVIFSGCLGCGKSTVARKAFLYVLYRIMCLRYPRSTFNVDADATIANVVIATTLKQVYDVNMLPFVKLMETMPCFQRVMSQRSFENFNLDDPHCPIPFVLEKSSGTVYFPDNIILTSGSQATHFTGMNVVNSFCDEINDKGMDEAIALLNTLDNRFATRFQGSDLVFQSVVSSARTTNSALGEYVRHLPKNDPSIMKFNPMLWEVKPDPNFVGDGTTFPVMVGNGTIPSKIITDPGELKAIEDGVFEPPAGCLLIDVPTVYRSKFELQLDQSIQDLAGIATEDNNMVFRDTSKLENDKLCPELLFKADLGEHNDLFQMLLNNTDLFEKSGLDDKYYLKTASKVEHYAHCDLSSSGECDTGLSLGHKEYILNPLTNEKETIYVLDFIMAVSAKTTIDLECVRKFYEDLVIKGNVNIHTISCDQYQSEVIRQSWENSGLFKNVEKVSVDLKLEPYLNAANLITTGHVKVGKCPKLKKELETLVFNKGKVEKTVELKDMADSLVGCIYNAQLNYIDDPQTAYIYDKNYKAVDFDYSTLIDNHLQQLEDI